MITALPEHEIILILGDAAYLGWTELSVERGIDSLCGAFSLTLTAREGTGLPAFPIAAGAPCQVMLNGQPLITGYVDRRNRRLDKDAIGLTVSGRDKACDLVDCSAMNSPGSWTGASLETIARALAAPFGIELTFASSTGKPLSKFAIQPGETAFAAIERLCRYRALIAFSDGNGGVTIGNPDSGRRSGAVIEGDNLLSFEEDNDFSQRFSQYTVKGQASGSDTANGAAVSGLKGEASDPLVSRNRPQLIIGEEQSTAASLTIRAQWEAQTRAARAQRYTATVPGWQAGGGDIWQPGARAQVSVPSHGLAGDLLIERAVLRRSAEDGTTSELTLVPPEAWAQLAEAEPQT